MALTLGPRKTTRRAATVAKQKLKSKPKIGKKRKLAIVTHDEDDDMDPDATDPGSASSEEEDEDEDGYPVTKRPKRGFQGRVVETKIPAPTLVAPALVAPIAASIPVTDSLLTSALHPSTATAATATAAATATTTSIIQASVLQPRVQQQQPQQQQQQAAVQQTTTKPIATMVALGKLNKIERDNMICKAELDTVNFLVEYRKMDALVRHKLGRFQLSCIDAQRAQLQASLHAATASSSTTIAVTGEAMPSIYDSPLKDVDWEPSLHKMVFKEHKGGQAVSQSAQNIGKCLKSVLSCCELVTPDVELVLKSHLNHAGIAGHGKKDALENWMIPRTRLSDICVKFFGKLETTLKKSLTAFLPKYVVFLNNKDNLYEHLCQLYLQSGKTKADLDGYYFGIRLRPEFQNECLKAKDGKSLKYSKHEKKAKEPKESLGIHTIASPINGSASMPGPGIRPPVSRHAKLQMRAANANANAETTTTHKTPIEEAARQAVTLAKAAAALQETNAIQTALFPSQTTPFPSQTEPLQARSEMIAFAAPTVDPFCIRHLNVLQGYAPITSVDVVKTFSISGHDCMLFDISVPHINWPKLKETCPCQIQNDELFIKFDYEMTPMPIDDHRLKPLRHVEIRHKQVGLSQLYDRSGYQNIIVLSNYHSLGILIAPVDLWHQQREIYDRSRSTLFGFYPEFAGHHLSVLEQMPHVAAASTIENINTNHHPHGVGMMGVQAIKQNGDILLSQPLSTSLHVMATLAAAAATANEVQQQWPSIKLEN